MIEYPNTRSKASEAGKLQKEAEKLQDNRQENRFFYFVVITIFLNILVFDSNVSVGMALLILPFQILLVFVMANRLGVEENQQILYRLLSVTHKAASLQNDKNQ